MKKELAVIILFFAVLLVLGVITSAYAWTPLVSAADFTGISTDVTTIGTGIITVSIIVLGVWLVIRAMSH